MFSFSVPAQKPLLQPVPEEEGRGQSGGQVAEHPARGQEDIVKKNRHS